jgi:phosphoribosylamine--glycine ligase
MQGDLLPILDASARGTLDEATSIGWGEAAVCVVLASGGYPRSYETGREISGLEALAAPDDTDNTDDTEKVVIFHAGTRRAASGIGYETAGGRVLGITARGRTVGEARERAYRAVEKISFDEMHFRRDIASRALGR